MFWSLLLFLSSLCWTHYSSNKLISSYHTHRIYFLMTFSWRALHWICNWSWIIVSWFCSTGDIIWLNNDTIFTRNPRITDGWIMIWLKLAIAYAFTVVLIWIILKPIKIDWVPVGRSSYISWGSHIVFVLHFLR